MKLLIYETTHHETLPAILDLSETYFETVSVFLKENTYLNLCSSGNPGYKWPNANFFCQSHTEANRGFIKRAISFFSNNNYTHFHISTLDNNMLYFAYHLSKIKNIHLSLSVQAINEYSAYKYKTIRDISETAAKFFFHKQIKHYRVFFPLMENMLEQKMPGTTAVFIPSRFFTGQLNDKKDLPVFRIVIPGSVDPNRRDYEFVLKFVKDFISRIIEIKPVELIILGSCNTGYGLKFMNQLSALARPGFTIKSYDGYIPQSEYESQLSQAEIIWSPVCIDTLGIRGTREIYGKSTATGLTADLLFNTNPALVPDGFMIPEHYQDALISYSSPDGLANWIIRFMREGTNDIQKKIFQSFSFFVKENFQAPFEKLMGISSHKNQDN